MRVPVSHRHDVFTIPPALRGLFERERKLLGLVARSAYEAVRKSVAAAVGRKDAVPGFVASIQTFGAYGPSFHPHIHAIVTEGAWTRDGEFVPLAASDPSVIARLHRAEPLSDAFRDSLLSWVHSGFSVYPQQAIEPADEPSLERLARYTTRSPIRLDAAEKTADGRVRVATPRNPRTGATEIVLDSLDWVHAILSQIPDRGMHRVRYYGAYACRTRGPDSSMSPIGSDRIADPSAPRRAAMEPRDETAETT